MSFLNLCKPSSQPTIEDFHLKRQLGWILFLRVVVLTILIGLTTLLETKEHQLILPPLQYVLYFIVGIYFYTILSALVLNRILCFKTFAYFQLITDVLFAMIQYKIVGPTFLNDTNTLTILNEFIVDQFI